VVLGKIISISIKLEECKYIKFNLINPKALERLYKDNLLLFLYFIKGVGDQYKYIAC